MQYGLYVSAAGALVNSYRQDVIANNLANVETVGFKQDLAMLTSRATEASTSGQRRYTAAVLEGIGGGVFSLPSAVDFRPSALEPTGNAFDLSLPGEGFFRVRAEGEDRYTRDGRFAVSEEGQLVTAAGGYPVLDAGGRAIALDGRLDFVVNEAGLISQGGEAVGRLGIFDFEDRGDLMKVGSNFFRYEGPGEPREAPSRVRQGHLERSGTDAMRQLTDMIKTQRLFQSNLNMLRLQDETMGELIRRVGEVS